MIILDEPDLGYPVRSIVHEEDLHVTQGPRSPSFVACKVLFLALREVGSWMAPSALNLLIHSWVLNRGHLFFSEIGRMVAVCILNPHSNCKISEDHGGHSLACRMRWHSYSSTLGALCLVTGVSVLLSKS